MSSIHKPKVQRRSHQLYLFRSYISDFNRALVDIVASSLDGDVCCDRSVLAFGLACGFAFDLCPELYVIVSLFVVAFAASLQRENYKLRRKLTQQARTCAIRMPKAHI